jgi:hypothetical protein
MCGVWTKTPGGLSLSFLPVSHISIVQQVSQRRAIDAIDGGLHGLFESCQSGNDGYL